jgi:hypothetical protein
MLAILIIIALILIVGIIFAGVFNDLHFLIPPLFLLLFLHAFFGFGVAANICPDSEEFIEKITPKEIIMGKDSFYCIYIDGKDTKELKGDKYKFYNLAKENKVEVKKSWYKNCYGSICSEKYEIVEKE